MDAILTTTSPSTRDAAHAAMVSARRHHPDATAVVVSTDGEGLTGVAGDIIALRDIETPRGVLASCTLDERNQALYALPFALERALEQHESVVFVAPGCLVTAPMEEVEEQLAAHALVLVHPTLSEDLHSLAPHLHRLTRTKELLSDRIVAARREALPILRRWQDTVQETFFDIYQRRPEDITSRLLGMLIGTADVGVAGTRTLTTWVDYAAVKSGRARGEDTAVITVDHLLDAVRRDIRDDNAEGRDVEWQLLADNVHDSRPLEPFLPLLAASVLACPRRAEPEDAFRRLLLDLRRAADPTGSRWGRDDEAAFIRWLYDRNPAGLTRIAHLYWRRRDDLRAAFPNVKEDPSGLRAWSVAHAADEVGGDLFTHPAVVTPPAEAAARAALSASPPASERGALGLDRVRRAVRWRLDLLRQVVPRWPRGAAPAPQEQPAGAGQPPRRRPYAVEAPRRIHVERAPNVFGDGPRQLSLIGCFRSESGLGQAARASREALRLLGREFSWVDTSERYPSRNSVDPDLSLSRFGAYGDVNLLHSNADELLTLAGDVFKDRLPGRFNAAMWFWETADLPERSQPALDVVDELWVASEYLADVFGQYGKVPVRVVGLAADLPEQREVSRADFGLRDDELVFLFVYDALSAHGRKNPEKALEAFIKAFAPRFEGVRFVLKVSNLNKFPASQRTLKSIVADNPAITLIDEYLTREKVLDLMAVADVYVSLHAAEGFGLTLMEAMALGTPTICTGYSGNMDFTTAENSWLVDYTLTASESQTGPYPPGSVWAKPDVDHAAELMRAVYEDREELARKRERAIVDAREAASMERYAKRLDAELQRVL